MDFNAWSMTEWLTGWLTDRNSSPGCTASFPSFSSSQRMRKIAVLVYYQGKQMFLRLFSSTKNFVLSERHYSLLRGMAFHYLHVFSWSWTFNHFFQRILTSAFDWYFHWLLRLLFPWRVAYFLHPGFPKRSCEITFFHRMLEFLEFCESFLNWTQVLFRLTVAAAAVINGSEIISMIAGFLKISLRISRSISDLSLLRDAHCPDIFNVPDDWTLDYIHRCFIIRSKVYPTPPSKLDWLDSFTNCASQVL